MSNMAIEILLASYNGEAYVREQIDSIIAQTNSCWHLTVSDDGSADRTVHILNEYVSRYPDRISRAHSGKKFGNARDHFFWLIKQCRADYMFTCDQDDRWYPEKLERMMDAMRIAEETYGREMPILVFSDQTPTDAQLHPLAPSLMRYQNQYFKAFDYRSILMQNVVTGGAMAFNGALAKLAMQCSETKQTVMHDWWIAAVAARFGKIIYIDEPLGDYRQHGANSVGAKDVRSAAHIIHKLRSLDEIRKTLLEKKMQARVFAQTYAQMLVDEDSMFFEEFVKHRSGPLFYWKNRKLIHGLFRLAGMMVLG